MATVSNSSPLIGLEQINQLDLLEKIFQRLLTPDAVAFETRGTVRHRTWIRVQSLKGPPAREAQRPALGRGEQETISLAIEVGASAIRLDDQAARRVARDLGLAVIGTAGVLLIAKERQLVREVRGHLDALVRSGFFLSEQVIALVLRKAGEW